MIIISLILLIVSFETYGQINCDWGKYGEACSKVCPQSCMPDPNRQLIHCHKDTGRCSEGCVPGWFEDLCDKACSKNCAGNICNRQTGMCTHGCSGNYTGDFCNTPLGTSAPPSGEVTTHTSTTIPPASTPTETPNLAAILVPVFLLLVVIAVVVFILFVRRKQKRGEDICIPEAVRSRLPCLQTADTSTRHIDDEDVPLTKPNEADADQPGIVDQGKAGSVASVKDDDSTCGFELSDDDHLPPGTLGQKIKAIHKVFIETGSFKEANEQLDMSGHVTITGGPGEGKTSMALMLGAEYRRQGYDLVLVEDVDEVWLTDFLDIGKDVCLIFDDIFKTVRSHEDLSGIKHFLYDLHVYLGQCESRSERRYQCLQQETRQEPRKLDQPHICAIFTTETNNLEIAMANLGGLRIFIGSSRVQICYTKEEKKELWLEYKGPHETLDEDKITAYKNTTVGFPLACKLFSIYADFQMHHEHFFEKPLFYITNKLRTIVSSLDAKSAALTLMILCEGQLNINHLETEGGCQGSQLSPRGERPDNQLKTEGLSPDSQVKPEAVSSDNQVKPEAVSSDSQVKREAASSDSQVKPERVSPDGQVKPKAVSPESLVKPESVSSDSQVKPKAASSDSQVKPEAVSSDNQVKPEAVSSDSQVKREAASSDSQVKPETVSSDNQVKPEAVSSDSQVKPEAARSGSQVKAEAVSSDNQVKPKGASPDSQRKPEALIPDSQRKPVGSRSVGQLQAYGDNPALEDHLQAVTTLVKTSTRQGVAQAARDFCGTFLSEGNMTTFSHSLIYDVCVSVLFSIEPQFTLEHLSIGFLLEHIQDQQTNTIPVSEHKLKIPFSKVNREILDRMAASFTRGALTEYAWHPIWRHEYIAERFTALTQHPDQLSEEAKHHILCYACVNGNTNILGQLVRHCDINRRGLNGWTPLMYAVVSEQMDCFDILVKQRADVSLCDNNYYNILHLACLHRHVPTVKHVKKFLKEHYPDSYTNQFLNIQARAGWTPVMCAVVFGTEGVSDCFIKPKKKTDKVKTKIGFEKKIDFSLRDNNGNTILHLACQYGNRSTVKNLLPDTDINTRGNNGQTPVMAAVLSGRKETVDILVSNKADLSLTDDDNNSILHMACNVDDVTLLEQMKTELDINTRGKHGWTPVMKTAVNGNMDVFKDLLDTRNLKLLKDCYDNNLLHLACHGGNVPIVQISLPKFDIDVRGNNGWTPVMFAAVNGVHSVFYLLVSKGADIRLRDDNNNSVLHVACIGGNISIVTSLLPNIHIDCPGNKGRTAIMVTALHARPALFELLLSEKANIRLADDNKDTILHLACEGGNCSIVKYLIRKFDINVSGRHGRTPVMAAALAGMKDVFDLLVSQNADLTLTDVYRDNVLHLACQGGNTAIVEHLVTYFKANLQEKKETVDQRAPRQRQGDKDSVMIINEVTDGLDIDIRGRDDHTPLMKAVCGGHLEVYKFLVSHKADPSLVDREGQTLLHLASRHGQRHVIEYIIDSVDINSRDKAGLTPVMTSVTCDKVAVFKYLRGKGADLSLVDSAGNDVWHLANKRENRQILELLEPPQKVKRPSGPKNIFARKPSQSKKKRQSQTEQTQMSLVNE
ncbi:uncharacterized protein LOC124256589 isoform X4 [Haliotis rubra]|uniref:uncharacterized protein LOC124256589 isoform X4 n=1 Tax=Haliotis rubra TaxID=36100 RepID=UPI001EE4FF0B|nr:uncharacterized protein LOC124256589 isoform X4 [Haliotis rubra]